MPWYYKWCESITRHSWYQLIVAREGRERRWEMKVDDAGDLMMKEERELT